MKTILVAFLFAAIAAAQPTVAVSGTVVEATGSSSVGSVTISWPTFVAHTGQPVIAGSREFRPSSGTLSATVYPGNYTVVYRFQNGSTTTMRWVVPVGAPWTRTIAEVQTTFVSTPTNYPLAIGLGGTGATSFTASRCIHMNAAGTAFESTSGDCGAGTVTSVAMTLPAIFSVSGSPITSSGTLAVTLANQTQGLFLGSPAGSTGTPSFRQVLGTEVANTPAGTIAATTAQAAINELESEKQNADPDLATIASLTGIDGQVIYRSGGAWTAASLTKSDVGLGNVDNTSDATKNSATATITNKTHTLPIFTPYTVATLPGSPTTGQLAVVTDAATAGSCTSGGGSAKSFCRYNGSAWESIGDGGSGGGGGLADGCTVTTTSTTITVASGCTFRIGTTKYTLASAAVWTTSGTPTVTAFVYGSNDGSTSQVTIGTTSGSGTCDADCTSQTLGSSGFPAGSVPIATVPLTAGAVGSATDVRNSLSGFKLSGGTGFGVTCAADGTCTGNVTGAYVDTTDVRLDVSCQDAGSTDAYACTPSPTIAAYVTGGKYRIKTPTANTGAATVNFNSLGAKTIKKMNNNLTTDLATGDVCAGQWVDLTYNGTDMMMDSPPCTPAAGGSSEVTVTKTTTDGTATACTGGTWTTIGSLSITSVATGQVIEFEGIYRRASGSNTFDVRVTFDGNDIQNVDGLGSATYNDSISSIRGRLYINTGAIVDSHLQYFRAGSILANNWFERTSFTPSSTSTLAFQARNCTSGETLHMAAMISKRY